MPLATVHGLRMYYEWHGDGSGPPLVLIIGLGECNEVIDRCVRTLKEQCLSLHRFETLDQARPGPLSAYPPRPLLCERSRLSREPGALPLTDAYVRGR